MISKSILALADTLEGNYRNLETAFVFTRQWERRTAVQTRYDYYFAEPSVANHRLWVAHLLAEIASSADNYPALQEPFQVYVTSDDVVALHGAYSAASLRKD